MKTERYSAHHASTAFYLLLSVFMLVAQAAFTQQSISEPISGKVQDASGRGIPGVSVLLKNTFTGTSTDQNGNFSLQVPDLEGTLIFSLLGFETREVPLAGQKEFFVTLSSSSEALDEVVVVGYGTQKKVNLTGSVSTISAETLTSRAAGQTSSALQGVAPGVTVTQGSGAPGSTGTIRIRGIGTLGNSSPLVLIDGAEGNIDNIDPNLIESVSVLKDAASASIYGSRAANGVILITTKRASGNQLSVTYSGYTGWQSPTNLPDKVNAIDHMLLTNEAYVNTGKSPLYPDELIEAYRTEGAVNRDLYPDTDWQEEVLTGSGFMQNHFVTINGGGEKIRFLASAGFFDQRGIIETSGFKRFTLRNNADITFSEKLSMTLDLQVDNRASKEPGRGTESVFFQMNRIPANQPGRYSNGSWGVGWNGNNPIAYSRPEGGLHKNNHPEIFLNTSLTYRPTGWLEAKFTAAPKYAESIDHAFEIAIPTYDAEGNPVYTQPAKSALTEESARSFHNNFYGTLTFSKNVNTHDFKLLLGASREDFSTNNVSAFRNVFVLPRYPVLNTGSAESQQNSGSAAEWALQSFFGRINYSYKQKYLLEINGRYDGSSRFISGRKYGFFPSVSAGWRVSEEPFMESLKGTVSELKLRGSWGRLGNQNIGNYPFTSTLALGSYTFNKQVVDLAALNKMANPEISWETTEMTDIGLDLTLFSNLTITGDYYFRRTRDILLELNIPLTVGLNAPFQNAGIVENRGWDLGLQYRGRVNEFRYDIAFNLSDVKNEVIDIRGVQQTGVTIDREGYPMNAIYGLESLGLFQSDEEAASHAAQFGTTKAGDIKYKDQNNDGIINAEDNVIIGSTIPRLAFGTTLNASYKGFDLNV